MIVSDPSHARYGQHLTHDEVNELVKPTDESLDLLHEWLAANGIETASYSPAMDWVTIVVDVSTAERLLDTEYHVYKHEDGSELVRAPKWSLPKHLHEHVDAIQPTTSFMRAIKQREVEASEPIPWPFPGINEAHTHGLKKVCTINGTTPDCFAKLYKTEGYVQKAADRNSVGFNNFLGEVPIRPDTKQFLSIYKPDAVSAADKYKFVSIANGPFQDGPLTAEQIGNATSKEANLDVQAIIGQVGLMNVTAFTTAGIPPQIPDAASDGGPPGNEPYLIWVNYVLAQKSLPQVISTSYGDDEQTVPIDYAQRVCNSFAQLGARGITLLFSSGDGGAGDAASDDASQCLSNDGLETFKFLASFPPSCPYITAVGGTMGFEPETSAYRPAGALGPDGKPHGYYASGSGFSEYFPRPSYQDNVVPQYVKKMNGEHAGLFNPSKFLTIPIQAASH